MTKTEVIAQIEKGEYHLSFSSLTKFMISPRKFIEYKTQPRKPPTDAVKRGYVFENLCLRDELGGIKIDKTLVPFQILDDSEKVAEIGGKVPRNTKAYREWKEENFGDVPQAAIIPKDLYDEAVRMRNRIWSHPFFKYQMKDDITATEVEVNWEVNGVKFLGYMDAVGSVVYDMKSIVDASQRKAYYTCRDRQYPLQIAGYCKGAGLKEGYIVACDASLEVYIARIDPVTVQSLNNRIGYYVDKFLECVERKAWDQGQEFYTDRGYFEWSEGII